MMLGGGCGRELAHWIMHGRPERDMYGYDIRYRNAHTEFKGPLLTELIVAITTTEIITQPEITNLKLTV